MFDDKEIVSSVFRQSAKNTKDRAVNSIVFYTIIGEEDEIDDDSCPILHEEKDTAYAKKHKVGKITKYYIKFGKDGYMANPTGMYAAQQRVQNGIQEYSFREVPLRAFTHYLSFLKTKNQSLIRQSEREII